MKKYMAIIVVLLFSVTLVSFLYADDAAAIRSQIAQLKSQRAGLMSQRASLISQLAAAGVSVDTDTGDNNGNADGENKTKDDPDKDVYTGKKPELNAPPDAPKPPLITPEIQDLMNRMQTNENGEPVISKEDVLRMQQDTRLMRDLKNAPPEVREAFNRTLFGEVYGPHDQKLKDYIRSLPQYAHLKPEDIDIDDFRTPKPGQSEEDMQSSINTDRDYRVRVKNENGDWIEVDTRLWADRSKMIFSESSGFKFPEGWDQMTGAERMKYIDEHAAKFSQMQTDKHHREAGQDYSDQALDERGDPTQKKKPNIVAVKEGRATLQDAEGLGMMYREKIEASLRAGDPAEAIAQAQKATHTLAEVRKGYELQGYEVGKINPRLQKAIDVIEGAKTGSAADPADVEAKLKALGYDGVGDVAQQIQSQMGALGTARQTTGSKIKGFIKRQKENFGAAREAHSDAKNVTEVVTKSADAAYTAHTLYKEKQSYDQMRTTVEQRNQKVAAFYERYDSDPEFRAQIDQSKTKLPSREPMKVLPEASFGEKVGIQTREDVLNYTQNVVGDLDAINSVFKLTDKLQGSAGAVGQAANSSTLANVKTGLGNAARKAGHVATVINTSRNVYEANRQYGAMNEAFDQEKKNVQTANTTLDRMRQTQARVKNEVADQYNGDWHAYVGAKRPDFYDMTPIQQAELVTKIQASANRKIEDSTAQGGFSRSDVDVLGSVDAGLSNAPIVGGIYGSGKNIVKAGDEGIQLGQAVYNEYQAEQRAQYTQEQVSNASNMTEDRRGQAIQNYRDRIEAIQSGKEKERGLTVEQLQSRLAALEAEEQ